MFGHLNRTQDILSFRQAHLTLFIYSLIFMWFPVLKLITFHWQGDVRSLIWACCHCNVLCNMIAIIKYVLYTGNRNLSLPRDTCFYSTRVHHRVLVDPCCSSSLVFCVVFFGGSVLFIFFSFLCCVFWWIRVAHLL